MMWVRRCPLLTGIILMALIATCISGICKDSTYIKYAKEYDFGTEPLLTLMFRGAADGVYPWSEEAAEDENALFADAPISDDEVYVEDANQAGQDAIEASDELSSGGESDVPDDETADGFDVSGNTVSGNDDERYELTEVDDDYFNDALFIGDSRTVGLSEYCEELDTRATFYAKISLTIYDAMSKSFIKTDDGKISIDEALSENQFGKIYIMLGLNEIGTGTAESFAKSYGEVIDRVRELQPDAIIYIQGIMHVTAQKSDNDRYFNNRNINLRNEAISQLADNRTVFYIDMNEAVDDENGNLLSELSFDGVHLKASSYERWHEFLLHNALVR